MPPSPHTPRPSIPNSFPALGSKAPVGPPWEVPILGSAPLSLRLFPQTASVPDCLYKAQITCALLQEAFLGGSQPQWLFSTSAFCRTSWYILLCPGYICYPICSTEAMSLRREYPCHLLLCIPGKKRDNPYMLL